MSHKTILRWREEGPAQFAADVLGADPTTQQWEGSRALAKRRRVSIRSGHGTGKSAMTSWAILWGLVCFPDIKIPCTAPTAHQLDDVLWAELGMWHRRLPDELRSEIEITSERAFRRDRAESAFAVPRTARPERPEALQGFHAPTLLFLIDEASGIPDQIFEVAEGALTTPGAYVLMVGNPTRNAGYFYDSHHSRRASWAALQWDGRESPLVSQEYVESMAERYGEESAIYRIRVAGEFAGSPDGVIPLDLIESAVARDVVTTGSMRWGLDVARFGSDRTALAKRRGNTLVEPVKTWTGRDTMQTVGMLQIEYDETPDVDKPEAICIDVIGLGAGVYDRAKEIGLPVIGVNVSQSPSVRQQYNRLRDELWFEAREWFARRDCKIVADEDLMAELTLPNYKVLSSGKKQVDSKDEIKKNGISSPDLADAFCLTFARGVAKARRPAVERPRARYAGSLGTSWLGA